jgi:L-lactate utilization protein LutC
MPDKILVALIGLVAGTVASLLAPWVHWGVEKHRVKLENRKIHINEWEDMLKKLNEHCSDIQAFQTELKKKKHYAAFAEHVGQNKIESWLQEDTSAQVILQKLKTELSVLEKKWNLL